MAGPNIKPFYYQTTGSISYVISDPVTDKAAIIDPVLHFDINTGDIYDTAYRKIIDYIEQHNLEVVWILETHVHADHLSAGGILSAHYDVPLGIGRGVTNVQETFAKIFNFDMPVNGSQFDKLFVDGETVEIGECFGHVMFTPGHTPCGVSYVFENNCFVGDTIFMPDVGTARTDFPNGNAEQLYGSIQRILSQPDDYKIFVCHDYPPDARHSWSAQTTVAEQKLNNIHLVDKDAAEFIRFREQRDAQLNNPKMLFHALQVNIKAGVLPPLEGDCQRFLKMPIYSHI